MTKKELIKSVSEKVGFTQKDITVVIDAVISTISNTLATEEVSIAGFGKFEAINKPERTMRNPATGGSVIVPAKKSPRFKASKTLKDTVNS